MPIMFPTSKRPISTFVHSTIIILFVLLGGMETLWGAILGAAIFTILPEVTRFMKEWRLALYGGILVVIMILRPAGIIRKGDLQKWFRRKRPRFASGREGVTGSTLKDARSTGFAEPAGRL